MKQKLSLALVLVGLYWPAALHAQYVSIPDSLYEPNVLIVWFQDGLVNKEFLGCNADYTSRRLDFNNSLIVDDQIYQVFENMGVISVERVVPNINPCRDTISVARRGKEIGVPEVWNILRFELDLSGSEMDIPNLAALLTMMYHPRIRIAEPSFIVHHYCPHEERIEGGQLIGGRLNKVQIDTSAINDPRKHTQYAMSLGPWDVNYGGFQIFGTNIFGAWDYAMGDGSIRIGVVDDGAFAKSDSNMAQGHEDFTDSSNVFISGFNYQGGVLASQKYYQATRHGTRVSGIIGAVTNNDIGIAGIAGGTGNRDFARLYALKVGSWDPANARITASMPAISAAIFEASTNSGSPGPGALACDLINLSIQDLPSGGIGSWSEILCSAVAYAYRNDVPVINAIGNVSIQIDLNYLNVAMPASVDEDHIIVVGGMDGDQLWGNSAYGASVLDICAPAYNISTGSVWDSTGYSTFSGTSSAAPHVTGSAALLLERQRKSIQNQNVPSYLAVEDYIQLLAESAKMGIPRQTGKPIEKRNDLGYGVLNTSDALALLSNPNKLEHLKVRFAVEPSVWTIIDTVTISSSEHLYNMFRDYYGKVKRYEIVESISYGKTVRDIVRVWVRGADTKGYPNVRHIALKQPGPLNPPFYAPIFSDCGWAEVVDFSDNSATIRTYLYEININGSWEWLNGITPDSLSIALSILSGPGATSVKQEEMNPPSMSLSVYPSELVCNSQSITVIAYSETNTELSIYDVFGRMVANYGCIAGTNTFRISRSALMSSGVYFIALQSADGTLVRKIMAA
jgi:subtilisin family serine protease